MPENRFLQSFCAVAASSVLVCGTLLLLTSTAPWTPPELGESSTPDAARDLAEAMPPLDNDVADETVAALGTPLNAESADIGPDIGSETADGIAAAPGQVAEADLGAAPAEPVPAAGDKAEAATDGIAGLLVDLPPRVIASDASAAATEEVAALAATLPPAPPPVIASERTGAATEEVAGTAAGLLPAPQPLVASGMGEPVAEITTEAIADEPVIGESRMAAAEFDDVSAAIAAMPAAHVVADDVTVGKPLEAEPPAAVTAMNSVERDLPELEVVELLPPPMPRRKPEPPAEVSVAASPLPEPEETTPVAAAAATPPARERSAVQPAPQSQQAQSGGLFGLFNFNPAKPMALAPADHPATPSRPATARPSGGAYASQVWSRLARYKPRAGQRGSASVRFTIGDMGVLRAAQIARSSGNARIDQLALQTVRSAAPFPAPPAGAVSYTIRIDFQ